MTRPRRVPDLCVLLVPEGPDRARVDAALHRAAEWTGGVPAATPHVTMAYLYDVTPDAQVAYAQCVEPLAKVTPPMTVTVTDVITQWTFVSARPDSLLFAVERTLALAALYDGLADQARHVDLLCNPCVGYRLGDSIKPRPISSEAWVPHCKVVEDFAGDPAAVAALLRPLAPDLSFCARSLCFSHRNEDGEWELGPRFALGAAEESA
ncbi:MAG: 2'-5' RNA ligase family protein [Chloroflexi bacterium]|nr:2'-5' RNA ligase family protein [Chloroflexota bacterium]